MVFGFRNGLADDAGYEHQRTKTVGNNSEQSGFTIWHCELQTKSNTRTCEQYFAPLESKYCELED